MEIFNPFERESILNNILHEAPEDENNGADEGFEEAPADAEPIGNDDAGGNEDTANEDNDDFTIDASDDGLDDTGDSGGGDTTGGDTGGNNDSGVANDANVDNAAKKKDREIFDSLSPQEQKVKTVKLNELLMDLYNRCDQIMEKYNNIGVEYEDLGVPINKSIEALYSLKQMISTYLLYLFDSKSYVENDIQFNRFLTALNQIKLITKDMKDAHKDEIEKALGDKEK